MLEYIFKHPGKKQVNLQNVFVFCTSFKLCSKILFFPQTDSLLLIDWSMFLIKKSLLNDSLQHDKTDPYICLVFDQLVFHFL
jgi:hypothetical protein